MERTRVKMAVYIDLDPVPGTMHTPESAASVLQNMLNTAVGHYNPHVQIISPEMVKMENKS